ncbi:peptidoglycan-binding domain-containing protein [Streptomyces tricolor]|uniref:peptidoglycan-binding domain-containing protein n=1 Tax=Streptomyces tricolor TaxID=68277 RepID=UPI0036E83286
MRKNVRNLLLQGLAAALVAAGAFGAVSMTGDQANATPTARSATHATATARTEAWPMLRSGSEGTDVRTAQHLLAARGHRLAVDGVFGEKTRTAVRNFQKRAHLKADGIVGPKTWSKLLTTVLLGSRGPAVKAAQVQLGVTVDGVFGRKTQTAVRNFQKRAHLKADGIVGPKTWSKLLTTFPATGPAPNAPKPAGNAAALAGQVLKNRGITFARAHSETRHYGSTAYANIVDMAAGRGAATSPGSHVGAKRVQLDPRMLRALITLHDRYGSRLNISEFVGGVHSKRSRHYRGLAFDANVINGKHVGKGAAHRAVMNLCSQLGATEILGPGDPHHDTHIHCAWK